MRATLCILLAMTPFVLDARADIPGQIVHQGSVSVHGERFSGMGGFSFALVKSGTGLNLWTNDGSQLGTTNQPDAPLSVVVINGVYSVALGSMPMPAIPPTVFENDDVLLRVWFDDGTGNGTHQLTPDQPLASAPYVFRALDADNAAEADHALEADHADDATTLGGFLPRQLVPAGSMFAYGGATAPDGWLLCDGAAVSRATYADLFAALGTAYGQGDGSTTFNLPDLRGRFVRGVAGTSGRDPDVGSRSVPATGGNAGNNVGSVQTDATARPNSNFVTATQANHPHSISSVSSHTHSVSSSGSHSHVRTMKSSAGGNFNTEPANGNALASDLGILITDTGGSHSHTTNSGGGHAHSGGSGGGHGHTVTGGGDNETRPTNIYVNWIIKH